MLPFQGSKKPKEPQQGGLRRPSAGAERGQRPRDQVPALFQESGGAGGRRLPHAAPSGRRSSSHAGADGPSPAVRTPAGTRPSSAPGHRPQHLNKGKAPLRLPNAPTGARAPAAAAARSKTAGAKRGLAATGQPRTSPGHKKPRTEAGPSSARDPIRRNPEAERPRQQQGAPQAPSGHAKSAAAKKPLKKLPLKHPSAAAPPRRASPASFRRPPLSRSSSPLVRGKPKSTSNSGAKAAEAADHGGLVLLLDKDRVERGEPGSTARDLKAALQSSGCPATVKEYKLPPGAGNFLFILSPGVYHGTPDPLDGVVVPFVGAVLPASQEASSSGLLPRSSDPRPTYEYFTDISANPRGMVLLEGDCRGGCVPGPVEDASELDDDIDGDGWSVIRCSADDTARLITEAARSLSGNAEQLSDLLWYSQYPEDVSEVLPCPLITLRQLKAELREDELPGDEPPGCSADDKLEEVEKEKENGKGQAVGGGSLVVGPRKASKLGGAKAAGRKSKPGGTPEAAAKPPLPHLQRATPSKRPREPQQDAAEGSGSGSGRQHSTRPPLGQEQSGAGRPRTAPAVGAKQGRADSSSDGDGAAEPVAAPRLRVVQPQPDTDESPTRETGHPSSATGPSAVPLSPHKQQKPRHRMESVRKKANLSGLGRLAAFVRHIGAEGSRTSVAAPRRPPESSKAPVDREQGPPTSNQPAGDNRRLQVSGQHHCPSAGR